MDCFFHGTKTWKWPWKLLTEEKEEDCIHETQSKQIQKLESENSVLITLIETWIKPHLKLELLGFRTDK